jgi:hypothetical protein
LRSKRKMLPAPFMLVLETSASVQGEYGAKSFVSSFYKIYHLPTSSTEEIKER